MTQTASKLAEVFEQLRIARGGVSVNSIAIELELPQSTIQRIRAGKTTSPRGRVVEKLADYFSVTPAQMRGEQPIERIGYTPRQRRVATDLPLINYDQVAGWTNESGRAFVGEHVTFAGEWPEGCFALPSRGEGIWPLFPEGYRLAINPFLTAKHGDYVVVQIPNQPEAGIKRLTVDPPVHILKSPLDGASPFVLESNAGTRICGVVRASQIAFT